MPNWLSRHWFAVFAVVVAFAQYSGVLFGDQTFFYRDFLTGLLGEAFIRTSALSHGSWPLWNPMVFGGYASALNPAAQPFYPLMVLFAVPNPKAALALFILAHHLIAAFGAAAFAKKLGATAGAAALAGAAFGLSAFTVSLDNLVLYLCAYAWLPWVLWATEALIERRWKVGIVATSVFLALIFLAGDPQATMFAGAWVFVRLLSELGQRQSSRAKDFIALASIAAILMGLIAVALVPGLLFLKTSNRLDGVTAESAQAWAMHPFRLAEAFVSQPFGQMYPKKTFWGDFTLNPEFGTPYFLSLYCSVVLALCVPLGFRALPRRLKILFGAVIGTLLLAALGERVGLYGLLFKTVPLWNVFRYPERLLPPVIALLTALSALGIDRLLSTARLTKWFSAAAAVLGLTALIALAQPGEGLQFTALRCLESAAVVGLVALARSRRSWVIAIVMFDIVAHAAEINWTMSFTELKALAPSFATPGRRLFSHPSKFTAATGPEAPPHEEQIAAYLMSTVRPNVAGAWGGEYLASYGTNFPAVFSKMWSTLPTLPLLRLWGVTGGVTGSAEFDSVFAQSPHVAAVDTVGDNVRFTIDAPQAREWLSFRFHPLRSSSDLKAWVKTLDTLPPSTLLEPGLAAKLSETTEDPAAALACKRESPNQRTCKIASAQPSMLVVSETFDEGWHATIDGQLAPVRQVNLAMQGVAVPAGAHDVTLMFRPRVLVWSGLVSLLTALLCAGALLWPKRKTTSGIWPA